MEQKLSLDTSFKIFDIANAGRPSFSKMDEDLLGKESLGILPADFGDRDTVFNFSQLDVSSNRESLGILQISNLMERESLGSSFTLLKTSDQKSTLEIFGGIAHNKTALKPVADVFLGKSSTSSINSTNFDQIEYPSKIYKYSLQDITGIDVNNVLNDTINNSKDLFNKFKRTEPLPSNSLMNNAQIVDLKNVQTNLSLPENLLEGNNHESHVEEKFRKFSVDICQMDKEIAAAEEADNDDVFLNTSVMAEANYLASKIADGSIYDETCKDIGMLDDTPQPDWQEEQNSTENASNLVDKEKNMQEIVFKNVDKFLPSLSTQQPLKIKTAALNANERKPLIAKEPIILINDEKPQLNKNESKPDTVEIKNKSTDENNMIRKRRGSGRIENKEILENLSQISVFLNTSRKSDSKKTEAQQLINNLTDLLLTNSSDSGNLDDSGHSSVQSEEVFEVLDLSKTSKISKAPMGSNLQALDLSVKHEVLDKMPLTKKISRSFSVGSSKPISNEIKNSGAVVMNKRSFVYQKNSSSNSGKSNQASSSTSGVYDSSNNYSGNASNKDSSNNNNLVHSNLRAVKSTSNIKKGPLKALHPVEENKSADKTPKKDNKNTFLQPKRTSTPIKEPNLRPMAQSTPTFKNKIRSKENSISPVTNSIRSKFSMNQSKPEASGKIPKFSYFHHKSFTKDSGKAAADKLKKEGKNELNGNPMRARSNSLGKENRVLSALNKVRQNILASPYCNKKLTNNSENVKEKRNIPILSESNSNVK